MEKKLQKEKKTINILNAIIGISTVALYHISTYILTYGQYFTRLAYNTYI